MKILGGLLSCATRALNVLTGGDVAWNFSARLHRDRHWFERVVDALFFWEGPGHCAREYADKIAEAHETIAAHEARASTAAPLPGAMPT